MSDIKYLKSLQLNKDLAEEYYKKSITKTYQQIFLEENILPKITSDIKNPKVIADIACGGGTLTYHISKIFPEAEFILSDINPDAIKMAQDLNSSLKNVSFLCEDFLQTSIASNSVDIVFCSQTLLTVTKPKKFLEKLLEITRKGGYFILSSLFNLEHDVDIYCKVRDLTRKGNIKLKYNTFSRKTISSWLKNKVEFFDILPFEMPEPLPKEGRGLGSYTLRLDNGKYITISGGILMQWGFLYGKV